MSASPPGSVKPSIGEEHCVYCGVGEYAANVTTCLPCTEHSTSAPGSTECTCQSPYIWNGKACALCPADHYYESTTALCQACPSNSSSIISADMTLNYQACDCHDGFANVPQLVNGELQCIPCLAGFYEVNGVCEACPTNSVSLAEERGIDSCTCMQTSESQCLTQRLDYSCSGTCADTPPACVACLPGSHKPDFSTAGNDETCVQCSVDEFQPFYQSIDCIPCPLHESHYYTNVSARETCKCDPGYFRRNTSLEPDFLDSSLVFGLNPCEQCQNGHFKSHQGDAECSKCHSGTYQPFLNATGRGKSQIVVPSCAVALVCSTGCGPNAVKFSNCSLCNAFSKAVLVAVSLAQKKQPIDLEQSETVSSVTFTQTCTACIPGTFKEHKDP